MYIINHFQIVKPKLESLNSLPVSYLSKPFYKIKYNLFHFKVERINIEQAQRAYDKYKKDW